MVRERYGADEKVVQGVLLELLQVILTQPGDVEIQDGAERLLLEGLLRGVRKVELQNVQSPRLRQDVLEGEWILRRAVVLRHPVLRF